MKSIFHSYTVMCLKGLAQGEPPGGPGLDGRPHSQHRRGQGTMAVHRHEPWLVGGQRSQQLKPAPADKDRGGRGR